MSYEIVKTYNDEKFRRVTGVKRGTFDKMVEIIAAAYRLKHARRGRHSKLTIENMLLATLQYLREYRTYAHIAAAFAVDESNIFRTIKWVEEVLVKDGTFSLPGRKAFLKSDAGYDVVLIDATETPIERPKKTTPLLFREKETAHAENTSRCEPCGWANHLSGFCRGQAA